MDSHHDTASTRRQTQPRDPCPWCHRVSRRACCLFATTGGIRSFLVAYGVKAGLAVLMLLIKGRLNFRSVRNALFALDPIRFGTVIGLISALTRFSRCFLSRLRGVDDKVNAFASAVVGGLASALDDPVRRSSLGIYLLCRAIYSAAHTGLRLGILPRIPGVTGLVFALANSGILYAFAYEPHLLDRPYYTWMMKISNITHEQLQWTLRDPRLASEWQKQHGSSAHPKALGDLPTASGSSWGVDGSPGVRAVGLSGRLTLPTISPADIDGYLRRSPGYAKGVLGSLDQCRGCPRSATSQPAHITHAASEALRLDLAEPLSRALDRAGPAAPLAPEWVHAALVNQAQPPTAFRHCDVAWHPNEGCMHYHARELLPALLRCARVYAPVHALPLLLFRRKDLLQAPVMTIARLAKSILRSSLFLSGYITSVKCVSVGGFFAVLLRTVRRLRRVFLCLLRMSRHTDSDWHAAACGASSALSLAFENQQRADELTLFTLPKGLIVFHALLARRGWLPEGLPGASVAVFALAMGVMAATDRQDHKPAWSAALRFLWGPDDRTLASLGWRAAKSPLQAATLASVVETASGGPT